MHAEFENLGRWKLDAIISSSQRERQYLSRENDDHTVEIVSLKDTRVGVQNNDRPAISRDRYVLRETTWKVVDVTCRSKSIETVETCSIARWWFNASPDTPASQPRGKRRAAK